MTGYVTFGDFSIHKESIRSVEETVDIDGQECVLVQYGLTSSILLYDDAAEQALEWARLEGNAMPHPLHYSDHAELILPSDQRRALPAPKRPDPERRRAALAETTLDNIGKPDDLSRVEVRELWDMNHYRVNVYRWVKNQEKMTDSHFVEIVEDGVISSPPMERRYYDDLLASGSF